MCTLRIKIEWVNQIKHLELPSLIISRMVDRNLNGSMDCTHKKSIFIGQVNKFCAKYNNRLLYAYKIMSVLVRLFKTYCCSFYGSQMWQNNSQSVNSVCTFWNKGARRILNIPHDANTWLLDSFLKQNHIKTRFIVRTLRFLLCLLKSHNGTVGGCTLNALSNVYSPMRSNLSFFTC